MTWDAAEQRRFWAKVRPSGDAADCWLWTGATDPNGYGRVKVDGRTLMVHRFAYESMRAEIPEGLHLDHLCRRPLCVNPDHLEPVTHRINTLRGMAPTAVAHRTNTCKRGHSLLDAYIKANGSRTCRTCSHIRRVAQYAAYRAARKSAA